MDFLFEGNFLLARSYYEFCCPIGGRTLIEYLGGIRSFLIDKGTGSSRQPLRVPKGKQGFFLYLKQVSGTRQVLEAKRFYKEDSHSRLSKRETCVNLFYSIKNLSVLLEGFS